MASEALGNRIDGVAHGRPPTGDVTMAGGLFELWGECAVSGGEASRADDVNVSRERNVSEQREEESDGEEKGFRRFFAHGEKSRALRE